MAVTFELFFSHLLVDGIAEIHHVPHHNRSNHSFKKCLNDSLLSKIYHQSFSSPILNQEETNNDDGIFFSCKDKDSF